MAFKMKKFSGFGNSPAKHGKFEDFQYGKKGHNPDTMSSEHEDFHAKQSGESPAKQRPENFNWKGGPTTTPGYKDTKAAKSKLPKDFNIKGGPTTTPGYESTKAAKQAKHKQNFDARQTSKQKGKDFVKNLKTGKVGKKVGKKILKKVGSKFLGPVGIGLGVVDAISVAGHSYDEGSLKKGVKKWWDSPGILPTKPKFKRKKKK